MKSIMFRFAAVVLVSQIALSAQQAGDGERQLRAAMNAAMVDGNITAAIEQYKAIVARFEKTDRTVAATALVRLAECYQKLGDTESKRIYERLVREFSDQGDAVRIARARLATPGQVTPRASGDRAVWTGSKVDLFGRVSPDGRFVTYVDWAEFGNLAVHDVAMNSDRFLTPKKSWDDLDRGEASWSAISPDGKQVAYGWEGVDNEIRILPIDASPNAEPRRVARFTHEDVRFIGVRDWSPDGKSLAIGLARTDGTSQIAVATVADGRVRILKTADWRGADRLAFSSDSKYLAYDLPAGDDVDQRDVFLLSVDGSRDRRVVSHAGDDRMVGWSPDGSHLLFTSDRTGSNALWAVGILDGKPQGDGELLKADIGADIYTLGLTKTGTLFAHKGISTRDVTVASVDLSAGKVSSPVHFSRGYLPNPQNPTWSPDGKWLAYQLRGAEEGLAVRSVDTGESRRLPRKLLYAREPRFSPDGRSLIVGGRDGKGRDGVFRLDVQSGDVSQVTAAAGLGTQPRWSHDGMKIYYRGTRSRDRVVERDLASGAEREIFANPLMGDFEVSPNGKYLAVKTRLNPKTGAGSLLAISINDGAARELVSIPPEQDLAQMQTFAWSADSSAVVWGRRTGGRAELWSVELATGRSRRLDADTSEWTLTTFLAKGGNNVDSGMALSPDGRHIAFLTGKSAVEVWAYENFLPAPPRSSSGK